MKYDPYYILTQTKPHTVCLGATFPNVACARNAAMEMRENYGLFDGFKITRVKDGECKDVYVSER